MNTSECIPYECVSPIVLENHEYSACPFLSGTGFFVHFAPYEDIFFITARHCVFNNADEPLGDVKVPLTQDSGDNEAVEFSCYLEANAAYSENEREDILVYVVGDISTAKRRRLKARALQLQHQDSIELLLEQSATLQENVRTVGYPGVSKEICYDTCDAEFRPRGFHAQLLGEAAIVSRYQIGNTNWSEVDMTGFSGSPILALCVTSTGIVEAIPIGVVLTEANFLSINVATDLIANYISASRES